MLQPTKDKCDFCDSKAHTRTFAGDNMCKAHTDSWTLVMQEPRRPGQSLNSLWREWIAGMTEDKK